MSSDIAHNVELGTWLGRGQAFGLIANKSAAAQAECLRQIRESGSFKSLCPNWEEFCERYIGLSRSRVDALIQNLEEFGATYFHLSQIVRVSPEAYRRLADKIKGESIEIDGDPVLIAPENAGRIRQAVLRLRSELQRTRERAQTRASTGIIGLQTRLDACFEEMLGMAAHPAGQGERAALRGLINYSITRLKRASELLPGPACASPPVK